MCKYLEDMYTTSTDAIRRPRNTSTSSEIEMMTSQVHAYQRYEYIAKKKWERTGPTVLHAKYINRVFFMFCASLMDQYSIGMLTTEALR